MCKIIVFSGLVSLLFLASCGNGGSENAHTKRDTVHINDYNVLFVPDLSNRINPNIHNKPVNDTLILNEFLKNIVELIDLKNRRTNQHDIYKFDFINKKILNNAELCNPNELEINLGKFKGDLQGSSKYLRDEIHNDVLLFSSNIKRIYDYALLHTAGADLWNYFNETISNSIKETKSENITSKNGNRHDLVLLKQFKNVVVLFTDGYIENANKTKGYVLDKHLVDKIRKDFNDNGNGDLEAFILSKPEYLLNKTNNDLTGINVLVLEMIDRSLDKNGVAIHQPTDFQIMKIIWKNWLMKSGADKVEVHQAVSKREEGYQYLKSFMESL